MNGTGRGIVAAGGGGGPILGGEGGKGKGSRLRTDKRDTNSGAGGGVRERSRSFPPTLHVKGSAVGSPLLQGRQSSLEQISHTSSSVGDHGGGGK